jgi:hypothetical protein
MGAKKKQSAKKQQKFEESSDEEEEEVDYAATADLLASDDDEEMQEQVDSDSGDESVEDEEKNDSDDESVEKVEEEEDSDDNSDEEMEDEEDASEVDEEPSRLINNNITVPGDEPCTFDLRNLLGVSSHPIDSSSLYDAKKARADAAAATIPLAYTVNEEYLLKKAEAGCNQIISALWQLPIERSDAGPMVQLPSFDDSKIPRALVRNRTCSR